MTNEVIMTAGKNNNLVTVTKRIFASAAQINVAIGTIVPAGMTRYVTYIRANQGSSARNIGSKVYLCSVTALTDASSTAACLARLKMTVQIPSTIGAAKFVEIPNRPDSENPLFTIAASKYLTARMSRLQLGSASCTLFVQYYDQ
jgi:hypothetical protein